MLSIELEEKAPYAATLISDLRQITAPYAVCVLKCRFVFCPEHNQWIRDSLSPQFQTTDSWESIATRRVTDLVPEKKQAELLLWGKVKPHAALRLEDAAGTRTLVQTRTLAPEPVLYWQSEWKPRPKGSLTQTHFMVAPSYGRFPQDWGSAQSLCFQGIFSPQSIANTSRFQTNCFKIQGILTASNRQTIPTPVSFTCDSLFINTCEGYIEQLWRARFPWDFMGEQVGVLWLEMIKI
jgi:hypothetical protein